MRAPDPSFGVSSCAPPVSISEKVGGLETDESNRITASIWIDDRSVATRPPSAQWLLTLHRVGQAPDHVGKAAPCGAQARAAPAAARTTTRYAKPSLGSSPHRPTHGHRHRPMADPCRTTSRPCRANVAPPRPRPDPAPRWPRFFPALRTYCGGKGPKTGRVCSFSIPVAFHFEAT